MTGSAAELSTAEGVSVRRAVKVLLLDEANRLLLLRGSEDGHRHFWFPVGGGIDADEEAEAACLREIAEETGRREVRLGHEVWRRDTVYQWRGEQTRVGERWFLAWTEHFAPTGAGMTDDEQDYVTGFRWWTADELLATTETVFPPSLGDHLARLLVEGPPERPVDIA